MLKSLSGRYEVIVFATSAKEIANKVVDHWEKEGAVVDFRLFREHCYLTDNNLFIKDLRVINRNLEDVILVDDCAYSFGFQLDNGVPIVPFTGDRQDIELSLLTDYIDYAFKFKDVQAVNREYFKYHLYQASTKPDEVYKKLF